MNSDKRFAALFRGNSRSHGVWMPDTAKMVTEKKEVTQAEYSGHLDGSMGVGIVPIMDTDLCWFGVLDIDNHGEDKDIDLAALSAKIRDKKIPLVACRSKSGGIHAYLFCKEPLRAKMVRTALYKWAVELGFPKAEIFPKQEHLDVDTSGDHRLGSWINLCYFDHKNTNRYALTKAGEKATLKEFLDHAESARVLSDDITAAVNSTYPGMPPCVERMMAEGVSGGGRNLALYGITVYLKKAKPNNYVDEALDVNNKCFNPPLPASEARSTIKSASRREYKYKCKEEPCKSLCDSKVCVTREFGIPKNDFYDMEAENHLPDFKGLIKYKTDPVKWGIRAGDKLLDQISTDVLYDFRALRKVASEQYSLFMPSLSSRRWDTILGALMAPDVIREIEMPDDASASGIIANRLRDFLEKAQINGAYDEEKESEKLLRGMPCIRVVDDVKYRVFRGMDFVKYLKSTKSEELKGPNLWFALSNKAGAKHARISIRGKKVTVWYVPLDKWDESNPEPPMPTYVQEF